MVNSNPRLKWHSQLCWWIIRIKMAQHQKIKILKIHSMKISSTNSNQWDKVHKPWVAISLQEHLRWIMKILTILAVKIHSLPPTFPRCSKPSYIMVITKVAIQMECKWGKAITTKTKAQPDCKRTKRLPIVAFNNWNNSTTLASMI